MPLHNLNDARMEFEKADNMASRAAEPGGYMPVEEATSWIAKSLQHQSRGLKILIEIMKEKQ